MRTKLDIKGALKKIVIVLAIAVSMATVVGMQAEPVKAAGTCKACHY